MADIMHLSQADHLCRAAIRNYSPSKQCASVVNKAKDELFRLSPTISCRELKVIGPPALGYGTTAGAHCVHAWTSYSK